jgi:energy-coupling factor transport system ATP-binding protein
MTIVMTTHETDEILDLADRVLVLEKGRIALEGTPAEVFSQPEILTAVGVKIPDALGILTRVDQLAGGATVLTDEQVHQLDSSSVGQHMRELISQNRLEVNRLEVNRLEVNRLEVNRLEVNRLEVNRLEVNRLEVNRLEVVAAREKPGEQAGGQQQPILEAVNLSYQYPGYPPVRALENINLSIRAGEMVGIVGQNGSGKSTLVKTFVGLLRPTRGEVRVNGKNIANTHVAQMARQVGLVLQNPDYQLFTSSCREEILFGLKNLRIEGEEAEEKVRSALALVGLQDEADVFPFRMSFGDRRKLAVAATVALDPQVLILDEPTTAQDHRGRYQLAEISRRICVESGRTILMITHDMDLIAHYAERLIVLWNGKIILDAPTSEAFARREILAQTFLRPPVAAEIAANLHDLGISKAVTTPDGLLEELRRIG